MHGRRQFGVIARMKETSGSLLRRARKARGLSQGALARAVGSTQQQIGRLEKDDRTLDIEWARRLAPPLGIEPLDLKPVDAVLSVPLIGRVSEGRIRMNNEEEANGEDQGFVEGPLVPISGLVDVRVDDTSLYPHYRRGDVLYFVSDEQPPADDEIDDRDYEDADGEPSRRRIEIRRVQRSHGHTYLQSFCHERRAFRAFRLDRIVGCHDPETGEVLDIHECLAAVPEERVRMSAVLRKDTILSSETDQAAIVNRCHDGVKVLQFLSRCDGHVHENERALIIDFMRQACDGGCLDATPVLFDPVFAEQYIRRQYPHPASFAAAVRRVLGAGGRPAATIMFFAKGVIEADDIVTDEEAFFLSELEHYGEGSVFAKRGELTKLLKERRLT